MKPVFKCEYCNKMGTEAEIKEHEPICHDNYDRRSCFTCKFKQSKMVDGKFIFTCENNIEIPEGQLFEFCKSYERKEKTKYDFGSAGNIFGTLFGF